MASKDLSIDEAEQYDRQLRLWGVQTQQRLCAAKVVVIGLTTVSAELAKHLVLSGVGTLCVWDDKPVTVHDLQTSTFLNSRDCLGQKLSSATLAGLRELNEFVKYEDRTVPIGGVDAEALAGAALVVVSSLGTELSTKISRLCESEDISFLAMDCFGFHGYAFLRPSAALAPATVSYHALAENWWKVGSSRADIFKYFQVAFAFHAREGRFPTIGSDDDVSRALAICAEVTGCSDSPPVKAPDALRQFLHHSNGQLNAVSAMVGSVCGQECIKVLSLNGNVMDNCFLFDGSSIFGQVVRLQV